MFPLKKSNEMIFHVSPSTSHQQNTIPQDLIKTTRANNNSEDSTIFAPNNLGRGCPGTQLLATNMDNKNDDYKKKMMHREIEKQRRKEMASLHAGLRSLIPLEYIKGKRSISDHMNCAVNYINHLKITISELSARRDNLIKESNNSRAIDSASDFGSSSDFSVNSCFAVHNCSVGVEVVLSSSSSSSTSLRSKGQEFPLSRVLRLLLGKGLNLVSCVTTKVFDEGFLHTIQAEVTGETSIELAHLQQTLDEMISSRK